MTAVEATVNAMSLTASSATVLPGARVMLTAGMPVSDAGTVSQEIVMQIDPSKVQLTSSEDIIAPSGWTLSYCSTTCTSPPTNYTTTRPTTDAGWAAVKAVRASGNVVSQGEYQGRQLAARTSTLAIPASGPFSSTGSGDGWNVFFDDRGYVFNVFHHQMINLAQVDCRDRNGVSCGPNWPYGAGTGMGYTSYVSNGWYDPVYKHIWFDATRPDSVVFECIDVAEIANPKPCGGNVANSFVRTGVATSPVPGTPNFGSYNTWKTRGIAEVGGRVFSQTTAATGGIPLVTCVDTRANGGLGAVCPGSPFAPVPGLTADWNGAVAAVAGKLLVTSSNSEPKSGLMCFEPATLKPCAGSWPQTWTPSVGTTLLHIFEVPSSTGDLIGICATAQKCFSLSGSPLQLNAGLATWYDGVGDAFGYAEHALRRGSRLYRGNGNGAAAGVGSKTISCWDQALNSGAGGVCANWPISVTNYGIALDPLNDNCLWKNDHANSIKAYDTRTATVNCLTPPSQVVIPAETAVPRMACSTPSSGVREWRSIKLLAPTTSGYTSASLTIRDSFGAEIGGWIDRSFETATNRVIDLGSLSVVATGQKPTFVVKYVGLTSSTNSSVEVVAVGDSPELCLNVLTKATCPVAPGVGLQPDSPATGSFMTLADGSSTNGSGTITYSQGSAAVSVLAGPSPGCAARLSGTALSNDASALPVPGATVTLLDSNGSAILFPSGHPQAGQAITSTTDSSGGYSFESLAAGTYKVKFVNTSSTTVQNARMISSSAGPAASSSYTTASGTGAARSVVSPATTIANTGPGVVNGYFAIGPTAPSRTEIAAMNTTVSFDPFAPAGSTLAATSSSGSRFTSTAKGATRLCGASETAPNCSQTSVSTTQGTWSVTTASGSNQGKISFVPASNLVGTVPPVSYSVTDEAGQKASGTLSPIFVAAPTAQNDTSTGGWDMNQTLSVLSNDVAAQGANLAASTLMLCPHPQPTAPYTATNCNLSSVSISGEGTYTANSNGTVAFDPLPAFVGQAQTPVRYVVHDTTNQIASALITPTVTPPPSPTMNPDTSSGKQNFSQTINPLSNDIVGAAGLTFTSSSVKLCSSGQTVPNCAATTLYVAGQGSYSVNTSTGEVTFTPCSAANTPAGASCTGAFTGTATPVTYQVNTIVGQTASSTITPTVVGVPALTADVSSGAFNATQTIDVLANDQAGTGSTLSASSVKLCTTGTAPASCTNTTLAIAGQGSYSVNTSTGVVTFTPCSGNNVPAGASCTTPFHGTATPIRYVASDALGQQSFSTITVTVVTPPAPTANPDTSQGAAGVVQSVFPINNDTVGAAGVTFTPSTVRLCVSGAVVPNCGGTGWSVYGKGEYSVVTATGEVKFTPCSAPRVPYGDCAGAFVGTVDPVTYQVTTNTNQIASSTYTPSVPPPPTVNPDSSVDEQLETQVLSPLSNDSAAGSTSLNPSSVKLCPSNATSPFSGTNCNLTTLLVADVGKYTVNSDGTVTFVPCTAAAGVTCAGSYLGGSPIFTGTRSVRYVVADQLGQYGSSTLDVEVLPPPVVKPVNDIGSSPFATPVVFEPLTNDSGGTTSGLVGYTSTGTATLNSSTLKLCGSGQSAPSCNASSVTTPEGVYALNALTNRITFTPATNFVGTPVGPPLYMVCNQLGSGWSPMPSTTCATAKVTPTIQPPAVPSAVDDAQTGPYNTVVVMSVLGNDTKDAALTIAASTVKLCATGQTAPNCTATSIQVTGEGTYSVNSTNGQVTFTPLPSFAGTVTVAPTYQFTDSYGATASAVITPTINPPPAPTASPQTKTVLPGASVQFTNVIGASGLGGGTGLKSGTNGGPCLVDPADSVCKTSFTVTGEGDWSIDQSTGIPTFVADTAASSGNQTAISYRVTDAVGHTASALLTPVIPPPATLGADSGTGGLDSNQTFNVLTNDTAGTGTTLVATTVKLCDTGQASPNCVATSVTINGVGTYSVDASGVVTFDPDANFTGQATPITYQVSDSVGRTYATIITPTVTAIPPTAAPDTVILPVGGTRSFQSIHATGGLVTRNLGGTALDPTSVCIIDPDTTVCGTAPVVITGEGTYTLDATTGIVTYTADPNATLGAKTSITYKLSDIAGNTVQSTLTPTIVAPPTTTADASSGSRGARQVISVLGNDTPGANSAPLVPSTVRLCGPGDIAPNCTATTITITGQGTFTVDTTTGEIVFTPVSTFTGDTTPVNYSVTDSLGQRRASSINITVQPDNTVPNGNGGSSSNGGGSSNGGILPTTGRNTSDHIGLVLIIVAIGIILTSAARRRIAFTN